MRPYIVMVVFMFSQLLIMLSAIERKILDLVELLRVGPFTPLHAAFDLGSAGRVNEEDDLALRQACSNCSMNSEASSIWMALIRKGNFISRWCRKPAAALLVCLL